MIFLDYKMCIILHMLMRCASTSTDFDWADDDTCNLVIAIYAYEILVEIK